MDRAYFAQGHLSLLVQDHQVQEEERETENSAKKKQNVSQEKSFKKKEDVPPLHEYVENQVIRRQTLHRPKLNISQQTPTVQEVAQVYTETRYPLGNLTKKSNHHPSLLYSPTLNRDFYLCPQSYQIIKEKNYLQTKRLTGHK